MVYCGQPVSCMSFALASNAACYMPTTGVMPLTPAPSQIRAQYLLRGTPFRVQSCNMSNNVCSQGGGHDTRSGVDNAPNGVEVSFQTLGVNFGDSSISHTLPLFYSNVLCRRSLFHAFAPWHVRHSAILRTLTKSAFHIAYELSPAFW
jgi:hypothetical protein